jgi:hypothetical protein
MTSRVEGQPLGWTEDWSWFTTWGGTVTNHPPAEFSANIAAWFAKGGSHHNYYMWYVNPTFLHPLHFS